MTEHSNPEALDGRPDSPGLLDEESQGSHVSEQAGAKSRPAWRKMAFRGVILLLAIAVFSEFWAQTRFRKHLRICQEALDLSEGSPAAAGRKVTYEELESRFSTIPTYSEEIHQFARCGTYTWSFQGVRRYTLRLYVDPKDHAVWDLQTDPGTKE